MCVYVLGRLASKEDVGGAASFCTYLRSIWQLYTQLSVHFPVAMEICNQVNNNDVFPCFTFCDIIISIYTYDCI